MTGAPGLIDLHCHLVPGVDDGAESVETAIEALKTFRDARIERVVTTPHLDAAHVRSPRHGRIEGAFERLAAAAREQVPEITLELAYEVRIDDPEVDLSDRSIGLSGGGAILVEFPQLALPAYSDRMLEVVREQGWIPVLAHPERYAGISQAYAWIERWRETGVILCMNVGSILGEHGRDAQIVARRMLASGHADVIGSDHHARPNRSTLLSRGYEFLAAEEDPAFEEAAHILTAANPRAVLEGEQLRAVPPLEPSSGWLARVRRLLGG